MGLPLRLRLGVLPFQNGSVLVAVFEALVEVNFQKRINSTEPFDLGNMCKFMHQKLSVTETISPNKNAMSKCQSNGVVRDYSNLIIYGFQKPSSGQEICG